MRLKGFGNVGQSEVKISGVRPDKSCVPTADKRATVWENQWGTYVSK